MALPMLLGAAARGIVKGGGRAAASKIMGRKKTVKPSAIVPKQKQQGQQQQKGGALVKSPTAAITKAIKIAYFLLLARSSGVIIPVFTNNNKMTGNSKHNPKAKISFIISERYSDILGSISIGREPSTLLT